MQQSCRSIVERPLQALPELRPGCMRPVCRVRPLGGGNWDFLRASRLDNIEHPTVGRKAGRDE
jgi:hypothetical protein